MRSRPSSSASHVPPGFQYAGIAHYTVCISTEGDACRLGSATSTGRRFSRYGLVVRHYLHQLPHKFLALELEAASLAPTLVRAIVRLRCDPGRPPEPDPVLLRDAVRWFKAVTTAARHRGVLDGRWLDLKGPVWARGFERRLLRSRRELAEARARFDHGRELGSP